MKLRTGDNVKVIAGKDKGKTGKIIQVFPKLGKVVVEGMNIAVKHLRGRGANQPGQRIEFPAPLHASKVMLIDPKSGKTTRVGYKLTKKGEKADKVRISKKSGEII